MRIYISFVYSLPDSLLLLAAAFFFRVDVIYAAKWYLHDGKAKSNLLVYAEIDILELQGFSWGVLLDGEPSQSQGAIVALKHFAVSGCPNHCQIIVSRLAVLLSSGRR